MRVLVWAPPWVGQGGDLFFFENAFKRHLLEQAKTLASAGWDVTLAFPDLYKYDLGNLGRKVNIVCLPAVEAIRAIGDWADPSEELYRNGKGSGTSRAIAEWLRPYLPESVDVVLQWETPVPYLKSIYPDALIIHQMPGAFSRAPYPHLVTFDPNGLYRTGSINKCASQFADTGQDRVELGALFADECRKMFSRHPVSLGEELPKARAGRKLSLLPLQISDHYAFREETGYRSQAEYCLDVLESVPEDNIILITQYISRLYSDKPITREFYRYIREKYPHAFYDVSLEKIPSVSQHLLQDVDEVIAATTGLAVQGLAWDLPISVPKNTHLSVLSSDKIKTTSQRLAIVGNIVSRLQPVANLVVHDQDYLTSLLEEMHSKRNQQNPVDRLVDFSTIRSNYVDVLMSGFRPGALARTVEVPTSLPERKDDQLEYEISDKDISLVSFDLFDTLVIRNMEAPADLYAFLEMRLKGKGIRGPFDFAQKRLDAELTARSVATTEEIQLQDIYDCLQRDTGISAELAEQIYAEEIELEVEFCTQRPFGKMLWEAARRSKARICVTSDMYLPESCIRRILQKNGFDEFEKLYLSSSVGVTKKSGHLFRHIAKEADTPPQKILHIGDTVKTDIIPAKEAGLETFFVPKSAQGFRANNFFSHAFSKRGLIGEPDRSAIVGLVAAQLFDDPADMSEDAAFKGQPWNLGYCGVGPMLLGLALWQRRQANAHDVRALNFLSREGLIMKRAFDRLEMVKPSGVASNYLYGSRRAIRLACLKDERDIAELVNQTIDINATVATLLEGRFGLSENVLTPSRLAEAGINSRDTVIRIIPDYKPKLRKLCSLLSKEILATAAQEREVYLEYLAANGFGNASEVALVDIGWGANMQGAMGRLLDTPLRGYYFATLSSARKWAAEGHNIHGYSNEFCSNTAPFPILNNRLLLEDMLCDVAPSVIRIERKAGGDFAPVFKSQHDSAERSEVISPIQSGALQFVDDACRHYGSMLFDMDVRPDLSTAILTTYFERPVAKDASMFEGRRLDDMFSGSIGRFLLSTRGKSYWQAGERALAQANSPAKANGHGAQGRNHSNVLAFDGTGTLEDQAFFPRLLLKAAYVPLQSRFTDYQRTLYRESPRELFGNFENPLLVGLGKITGLR